MISGFFLLSTKRRPTYKKRTIVRTATSNHHLSQEFTILCGREEYHSTMNRLVALLALVACTSNAFTATPPAFVSQLTRVMSPLAMDDTLAEAPASTGIAIRYVRTIPVDNAFLHNQAGPIGPFTWLLTLDTYTETLLSLHTSITARQLWSMH